MILVETLDRQSDSGLYTLGYHLLDQMMENIRGCGTLFFLDRKPCEHFTDHIKQAFSKTLQRTQLD